MPTLLATLDNDLPAAPVHPGFRRGLPSESRRALVQRGQDLPQCLWPDGSDGHRDLDAARPEQARHHRRAAADIQDPDPGPGESRLAEKGGIGEICIAGIGLAVGYVNRPDLTEKAFIPDFLGLADNPSGRIYRTGDLGRITGDGEIEYLGRLDAQVKIRGYRIELAEIESVIMRVPGIAQAVVGTFQPEPGMVELVAYYTLRQDVDQLRPGNDRRDHPGRSAGLHAARLLREDGRPAHAPVRQGGPQEPAAAVRHRASVPEKPTTSRRRTTRNREIAGNPHDLLKLEQVSMDDHFFNDLGANSLLMARFCARIRERAEFLRRVHAGESTCTRRRGISRRFLTTQAPRSDLTPAVPAPDSSRSMWRRVSSGVLPVRRHAADLLLRYSTLCRRLWSRDTSGSPRRTRSADIYLRSLGLRLGHVPHPHGPARSR